MTGVPSCWSDRRLKRECGNDADRTTQQAKWALDDVVTLAGSDDAMAATKLTAGGDL